MELSAVQLEHTGGGPGRNECAPVALDLDAIELARSGGKIDRRSLTGLPGLDCLSANGCQQKVLVSIVPGDPVGFIQGGGLECDGYPPVTAHPVDAVGARMFARAVRLQL